MDTKRFLVDSTAKRIRAQAKPIIEHWLYPSEFIPPLLGYKKSFKSTTQLEQIAPFLARDLTSKDTVALVLNKTGKVLAIGKRLPEEPPYPSPVSAYYSRSLAGENEVDYTTWIGKHHLLVIYIPLRELPGKDRILGVVQLSTILNPVDKILTRQKLALSLGIVIALISGVILALFTITSILKELADMVVTCKVIANGDLNRRVVLPRSGDEVGELASAFNDMIDRINASFKAQKRFIAKAAHELRTPVTVIMGSLEILVRIKDKDPKASINLILNTQREAQKLHKLCESLLDLSRLDLNLSSYLRRERIDLENFFSSFIEKVSILASNSNRVLAMKKGPPVSIDADAHILDRVLYNLIENSIRHTDEGNSIVLGWDVEREGVKIWIQDEGEGIHPEDLPHIFEPFYQGKKSRKRGGTGLGLALVKAMIEAHGGSIRVHSHPTKGATFTIILPVHPS